MLTDLYQLTMMYGYYKSGNTEKEAVFDLFFRETGNHRAYAVLCGIESIIDYINNLRFTDADIAYLRSLNLFDEDFLSYLKNFKFTGDIYAMPEGTVVFPMEPLVRVRAKMLEAQFIETALLVFVNHQTSIASKASRIKHAAGDDAVVEFGLRRAHGADAGTLGARAAIIGGCSGTSNVLCGQLYGSEVKGTHAHSWVMSFESELEAFRAYARCFPNACMLLVDTYDTLKSGVPNAITVFRELREQGYTKNFGIRLDSGDLAYLSKEARKMLDEAGFPDAKIFASSDLDEYVIRELKTEGAKIDFWGVGTRLITSSDYPVLGGVYKLSAEIEDGVIIPKIKISDNPIKTTNPGYKKVFRLYSKHNDYALADVIALDDEVIDDTRPLKLYHPEQRYKSMVLVNFYARELLQPIFLNGKQVYQSPSLEEICEYARKEIGHFWDEYKRLLNPQVYKVDLSDKLYDLKQSMIASIKNSNEHHEV
jgi:nicotinate phosphoribosyltransferase